MNFNETMFYVTLLVTLPSLLPTLSKNVGSRDHCGVCVCIHTHAFQLLNQLAGLHEALYKCYAITARITTYSLVFL